MSTTGPLVDPRRLRRAAAAEPVGALAVLLAVLVAVGLTGTTGRLIVAVALLVLVVVAVGRGLEVVSAQRDVAAPVLLLLVLPALLLALWWWGPTAFRPVSGFGRADGLGIQLTTAGLAFSGPILLYGGVHALAVRRRAAAGTPWRSLVGADATDRDGARLELLRAGLGVAMVVVALALWVGVIVGTTGLDRVALIGTLALGAAALIGGPVLIALVVAGRRDRAERELAVHRQAVAAHLHDSVLQTFALIQRNLDDPERVRRLVRTQERDLRAWLSGREVDALQPTLSGALRAIADGVEEEHAVTVELDLLDDPPVLEHHRPLLEATREALRNAARHGGGAGIRVLAETTTSPAAATVVYVRDDGPGFDPDAVPAARRGVRDAIVGRMTAAGGTASVDTAPGAGTEVVLALPDPTGGRSR